MSSICSSLFSKRKRNYAWLISDGAEGAFCSACSVYYKDRPLPKGSDDGCIWTQYSNTGVHDGRWINETISLTACKERCRNTTCHAIVWKNEDVTCWTVHTPVRRQYSHGRTHYNLICPSGLYHKNYVGCYKILVGFIYKSMNFMTVEACIKTCRRNGSTYAGLQHGMECSCFDYFNASLEQRDSCRTVCTGNQSEYCGGLSRFNSIYTVCDAGFHGFGCDFTCYCEGNIPCYRETGRCLNRKCRGRWTGSACNMTALPEEYIGCYQDNIYTRLLPYPANHPDNYEVDYRLYARETCSFICMDRGYTYFGLEFGEECYCGNDYSNHGPKNESDCSHPCTANKADICGGPLAASLYSVCHAGFYGRGCVTNCNCRNNSRCDYTSGACPSGCKPGWMGENQTCNVRNCNVNNGDCPEKESCVRCDLKYTSVNRCTCVSGHRRGQWLWNNCTDINECSENFSLCNVLTSECINTIGSFRCKCNEGYRQINDTLCADIDECRQQSLSQCDKDSTICNNTVGGYECNCKPGFRKKDQYICTDVDECRGTLARCHLQSTLCNNTIGGYQCNCKTGYTRKNTFSCTDFDECRHSIGYCDSNTTICNNVPGGYDCTCKPGYTTNDRYTCRDINECQDSHSQCNKDSSICQNTIGGYECNCMPGYSAKAPYVCEDIDECRLGIARCDPDSTICNNVRGGYYCICKPGYSTMNPYTCRDIDECRNSQAQCNNDSSICHNIPGGYECNCKPGYSTRTRYVCEDIDECRLGIARCDLNSTICNNIVNGYNCICKPGYTRKDPYTCRDIDKCQRLFPLCDGETTFCDNIGGEYQCSCKPGYKIKDNYTCTDIDECQPSLCDTKSTICNNTVGSYKCICKEGYTRRDQNACIETTKSATSAAVGRDLNQKANIHAQVLCILLELWLEYQWV